MWKNIAAIHSIFKKKITKQKFKLGQYLKCKINKNNFGKTKEKINEKNKKIIKVEKKSNFEKKNLKKKREKKTKKKEKRKKLAKKMKKNHRGLLL
jgi:hypothetical protein